MNFLQKLFGSKETKHKQTKTLNQSEAVIIPKSGPIKPKNNDVPEIITRYRESYKGIPLNKLNDLYFQILEEIRIADRNKDINSLLMHCQASLGLVEYLIKYTKKEYGRWDIKGIPAIDKALIYFAINGNTGQLKNIQEIVDYFKELHSYKKDVDDAFKRRDLAAKIYQYIKANPHSPQADLKKNINFDDSRFISTTINYMEKAGKLIKTKKGNSTEITFK